MKRIYTDLSTFLKVSSIFFLVCGLAILFFDKAELHLFLNQFHTSELDLFFKYYTHIGDGIFPTISLPIVLVIYRKHILHNFIVGASTFVLVPAIVQFLKRVVFYKEPRPVRVLGEDVLHLVPNVEMSHVHSFPSGHSATIFALFIFLSYIFRSNRNLQIVFAISAILGAYSRVYLSQHFIVDILAGGVLGVCCFLLARICLKYPLDRLSQTKYG